MGGRSVPRLAQRAISTMIRLSLPMPTYHDKPDQFVGDAWCDETLLSCTAYQALGYHRTRIAGYSNRQLDMTRAWRSWATPSGCMEALSRLICLLLARAWYLFSERLNGGLRWHRRKSGVFITFLLPFLSYPRGLVASGRLPRRWATVSMRSAAILRFLG
jgi:hypothetical protein